MNNFLRRLTEGGEGGAWTGQADRQVSFPYTQTDNFTQYKLLVWMRAGRGKRSSGKKKLKVAKSQKEVQKSERSLDSSWRNISDTSQTSIPSRSDLLVIRGAWWPFKWCCIMVF